MAEHRVRKNNIIYIIPTDELFIKWKNDEAFIDEYGRLMNRKPHRVEVKGDNKIDDEVVLAKKAAAEEMAVASGIHYLMYAGSTLMKSNVLEPTLVVQQASIDI